MNKKRRKAKKRKLRVGRVVLIILAVVLICSASKLIAIPQEYIKEKNFSKLAIYKTVNMAYDDIYTGDVILVNASTPYHFEKEEQKITIDSLKNDSYRTKNNELMLNKNTILQFNKMFKSFEQHTGLNDIKIISAYRTYEYQDMLFTDRVNTDGYYEALNWVAMPGNSEHHTGLTADLGITIENNNDETATFTGEGDYTFIPENAWKYGFILRYPENKTSITATAHESWHYRYVGKPHAYIMYKSGMCLEEYEDFVKSYTYGNKYIDLNINGDEYKIYYVPATGNVTEVKVPMFGSYSISGNNFDGFIVTEKD